MTLESEMACKSHETTGAGSSAGLCERRGGGGGGGGGEEKKICDKNDC